MININIFETTYGITSFILSFQFISDNMKKVKLETLVEGYPKAPFSIATTLRWREGHYSIPWIAPPYPWSLPYNAEC